MRSLMPRNLLEALMFIAAALVFFVCARAVVLGSYEQARPLIFAGIASFGLTQIVWLSEAVALRRRKPSPEVAAILAEGIRRRRRGRRPRL